jgi:hypothetical protein
MKTHTVAIIIIILHAVLFDTLMEQVHDDEILAILGHELGR